MPIRNTTTRPQGRAVSTPWPLTPKGEAIRAGPAVQPSEERHVGQSSARSANPAVQPSEERPALAYEQPTRATRLERALGTPANMRVHAPQPPFCPVGSPVRRVPQYDEIEVKWQRTLDKWYLTQNKPISATLPSPGSASYTMELFDKKVKYRDRPIDEAMVEMLTAFAAHIALRRGFKCWDRHAESLKRVALRLRFASREWRCRAFLAPMQKWRSRAFVWRAKARARSYKGALRMLRLCRRWLRRARVCKRRLHLQAKVSTHALKWWRLQARRTMDALAANATRRKFVRLSHHLCERQQQSARRCALHGALGEWRTAALARGGRLSALTETADAHRERLWRRKLAVTLHEWRDQTSQVSVVNGLLIASLMTTETIS